MTEMGLPLPLKACDEVDVGDEGYGGLMTAWMELAMASTCRESLDKYRAFFVLILALRVNSHNSEGDKGDSTEIKVKRQSTGGAKRRRRESGDVL